MPLTPTEFNKTPDYCQTGTTRESWFDNALKPMSPYRTFSRTEWAKLGRGTPLTLSAGDVERLRGLNDPVSLPEVADIYLPLSRLLSLYVEAVQGLFMATKTFLKPSNNGDHYVKVPYIIGISGSVACGKSTTARLLKALLQRWPSSPKVDLITTDGFLLPNHELAQRALMERKGFPESYDTAKLLRFLDSVKAGKSAIKAPIYSHHSYDIVPDKYLEVNSPDILLLEGLNILQTRALSGDGQYIPFISDFLDFSVYIDADECLLENWFIDRFMRLRDTAFRDPDAYFHRFTKLTNSEAKTMGSTIWRQINRKNLIENILPTRPRADLILSKSANHSVTTITFRKL